MKTSICILLVMAVVTGFVSVSAEVPQYVNYQGRLTDPAGEPVMDGDYLLKFAIWDMPEGGNELWNSGFKRIAVASGLFATILGDSAVLPQSLFSDNPVLYLGITVGADDEIAPRSMLVAVPYAQQSAHSDKSDTASYSQLAETVVRSRDLYHQILDVNPNSVTRVHFVTRSSASSVMLYLYGDAFQGAFASHMHEGTNSHSHGFNGSIGSSSVSHTHSFSGTTASGGASHTHGASATSTNVSHTHTGSVAYSDPWHFHPGTTASSTEHRHTLAVDGAPGNGIFLVASDDVDGLSSSNTEDRYCSGSVMLAGSHIHGFNTDVTHINHNHGLTINSWTGGSHSHSVSVNSATAGHSHSFSGTTGSHNISHDHSITGTVETGGGGLESSGINPASLPSQVNVYVDDIPVAGPFDGAFSMEGLDLSSFVSGAGVHVLEIREEGGSGGRISYNLFVD